MLNVSYSQCLADPTYCDDGKTGGAKLVKLLGVKPNQPVPLKDIVSHCTVAEVLWCLRVVRKSQQTEANRIAEKFIFGCLEQVDIYLLNEEKIRDKLSLLVPNDRNSKADKAFLEDVQLLHDNSVNPKTRAALAAVLTVIKGEGKLYSQIAIDLAAAVIKLMLLVGPHAAVNEEKRQKQSITDLLNGELK